MKKYICAIIVTLFMLSQVKAQIRIVPQPTKDTSNHWQVNDTVSIWTLNKQSLVFKNDTITEIWEKYTKAEDWQINAEVRVWSVTPALRLWKENTEVKIWTRKKQQEKWKEQQKAAFWNLNDSLQIWEVNDTLKLTRRKNQLELWQVKPYTRLCRIRPGTPVWQISDTTRMFSIDDTTKLWTWKKKTVLWELNQHPKVWNISKATKVWTLNDSAELWEANDKLNLWKVNPKTHDWEKIDTIKNWKLSDTTRVWRVNEKLDIWIYPDLIQLWETNTSKKIWWVNDSLRIWTIPPPPPPKDTVQLKDTIQPKPKKTSELLQINENTKVWTLDSLTKVWKIAGMIEVWNKHPATEKWDINDTTSMWTIDNQLKVSLTGDTVKAWSYVDSTQTWHEIEKIRVWNLSPQRPQGMDTENRQLKKVWEIKSGIKMAQFGDSVILWNVINNVKQVQIFPTNSNRIAVINDSTTIWKVNADLRIWVSGDKNTAWEKDESIKAFEINDSTKIWQVSQTTRLSLVNDSLSIWTRETKTGSEGWKPDRSYQLWKTKSGTSIFDIHPGLKVWKEGRKVNLWRENSATTIWNINDSTKVYTFKIAPKVATKKKPKYWKLGGTGNINLTQKYFDHWVKGGDKSFAATALLKLSANYNRNKTSWENNIELNYGLIQIQNRPFRKDEDKIEISTKFGQTAFRNFYYSLISSLKTQLFRGYDKHPKDTVLVSTFFSPANFVAGLGLDFKPSSKLSVVVSPITLKTTYMHDTTGIDQSKYGLQNDKKVKHEPGAYVKTKLKLDVTPDILVESQLDLFTNYKYNPECIDVEWQTTITLKVNKYINANISTHLIYDDDVKFSVENDAGEVIKKVPRVQFKEVLNIGFSYKF